ncbi:MAG: sporulation protein [Lachnospiraceae bacterium]
MKQHFLQISILLIFFALLLFPEISIAGAKDGLLLWYNSVVPTLFPFMILSNIMLKTNSIECFHLLFTPLYRLFPKFNKNLPYLFLLGFFCGYPMGAKTMDDFLSQNLIDKTFAKYSLVLFNHASPMFLIGYILTAILKNKLSIPVFFFILYSPYLVYGILLSLFCNKKKTALSIHEQFSICKSSSATEQSSICKQTSSYKQAEMNIFLDSFFVLVKVGCYMMLFSILCQFFIFFLPENHFLVILLIGMTEVTTGVNFVANSTLPFCEKIALICGLTSFGGLCSLAQTKGVLTKSGLSVFPYFIQKLLLGSISYLLAKLFFI